VPDILGISILLSLVVILIGIFVWSGKKLEMKLWILQHGGWWILNTGIPNIVDFLKELVILVFFFFLVVIAVWILGD
jgi:hypothetical protein